MAKESKRGTKTSVPGSLAVVPRAALSREERVERSLRDVRAAAGKVQATLLGLAVDCLNDYFNGDPISALGDKNIIRSGWSLLMKRLREESHGISASQLWFAVRVLAANELLRDVEEWIGLDTKKKELLLVLRNPRHLADAAKHVARENLTSDEIRLWLAGRRKELGAAPRRRSRRIDAFMGRLDVLARTLDDAAYDEFDVQLTAIPVAERRKAVARIDDAIERLTKLKRRAAKLKGVSR